MAEAARRYEVVTGGNKGIGFGICKQLASNGITVSLTARDQKKGLEAVEKLRSESGVSGEEVFHQVDVTDPASVPSLANFIRTKFGKLDILVNNAGISGVHVDKDALMTSTSQDQLAAKLVKGEAVDMSKILTQEIMSLQMHVRQQTTLAPKECVKKLPSGWAKGVLRDAESLTEEKVDEVLKQFLADFKEGSLETEGWPTVVSAYTVSKAALNTYTRILAKKYLSFCVNSGRPGYVKTDMYYNAGYYTAEEALKVL